MSFLRGEGRGKEGGREGEERGEGEGLEILSNTNVVGAY